MKSSARKGLTVYPKSRRAGGFKQITCRVLVSFLDDYVENRLPAKVRRDFQRHIRECKWCEDYLATYRKTIGLTGELHAEDIPVPFRNRLRSFLRRRLM